MITWSIFSTICELSYTTNLVSSLTVGVSGKKVLL